MRIFGNKKPGIKLVIAGGFTARLRGLLGLDAVPKNFAMFFPNTASVHTFFMKCRIDIIMTDATFRVLGLSEDTPAFRIIAKNGAVHTLEMASGEIKRLKIKTGDRLNIKWPRKK